MATDTTTSATAVADRLTEHGLTRIDASSLTLLGRLPAKRARTLADHLLSTLPAGRIGAGEAVRLKTLLDVLQALPARPAKRAAHTAIAQYRERLERSTSAHSAAVAAALHDLAEWVDGGPTKARGPIDPEPPHKAAAKPPPHKAAAKPPPHKAAAKPPISSGRPPVRITAASGPGWDDAFDEIDLPGRPITIAPHDPGLLGDDGSDDGGGSDGAAAPEPDAAPEAGAAPEADAAPEPDARYFLADIEDHDKTEPLTTGGQYTIAFAVGESGDDVLAKQKFDDRALAAVGKDVTIFDLTVQLDSDDFDILGDSTRPLRCPRVGRSLGKARFDISPKHDGASRLFASVHYQGNFIQQMELSIPVGAAQQPALEVTSRGRPPGSAATLEPRDISLVLEPAPAGGFACTAMGAVAGRTTLPITDLELAKAVEAARAAMMTVIQSSSNGSTVFTAGIEIPDDAKSAALRTLARAGARLFQQLFQHPAGGADASAIGNWLTKAATDPAVQLTVQVVADHAPLPWAMLYLGDASDGAVLDWDNFLGMRHIVEQLPLQMSLATVDNHIASQPQLSVSVNVNTSIDAGLATPVVAGHQKYWADLAAARKGLTLVSRSTKSEVVAALKDAATGDQVVYFYCHATAGGPGNTDPDASAIIMGKGDSVTVADLNLDAPTTIQLAGNPLVFINACESAELTPLFYNGFVPYFMAKGARGVIGTECKTPVIFAIEWADAFFAAFMDGQPVGATVLDLRRQFLQQHGNPLGLIYAVHCDADTRINPGLPAA